jgi:peroxiredoxin
MSKWMMTGVALATASIAAVAVALPAPIAANTAIGAPAINFSARDENGKAVWLHDFKGKTVVLEWHNAGCPFVQKHYKSGNMQKTQAAAAAQGVVWLTINSSAAGQQGHMDGPAAKQFIAGSGGKQTSYLLDPAGVVGKAYGAKTTPHMYIIDGAGRLVYRGGIDDKPTADQGDIASARNHVLAALSEIRAGKPVSLAETRPYGCSVKYAS